MTPRFLTTEEVLDLHRRGIERYGGGHGVRDQGLVESAVMAPQASFGEYLLKDISEMAASYWFGLTQNHGFIDGNKRIGLRAADAFLLANGYLLAITAREAIVASLQIAEGACTREDVAKLVRANLRPIA